MREHADDVFDFIIKPAMEECGITPERSDHFHEPGLISEQMLRAILEYDLCIAVLTFDNPNVYYELAIAQASNRPVVLLLKKGSNPPFDIKDMRYVEYDLKPRALFDRVYSSQVVKHVKAIEASGGVGTGLPGVVLPGPGDGPCTVLPSAEKFGSGADWLELLERSGATFSIAGINLHDWRRTRGFTETVARKASEGCRVRALMVHPDNPAFRGLINDLAPVSSFEEVQAGLASSRSFFDKLAAAHDNIELRSIQVGCPHFNLTLTDRTAVAIPYLYSTRTAMSPLLRCEQGTPLFATFRQEFDSLWDASDAA